MRTLQRIFAHPLTELCVGLVLLTAGTLEMRDIMLVKLPSHGPMLPHALALLGLGLTLRSLPFFFLGLGFVRRTLPPDMRSALAQGLDRLTHCHGVELMFGLILIASGLADIWGQPGLLTPFNSASGAVALGLAPAVNALIAVCKGMRRVDGPKSLRLLVRAVHTPWVQGAAGSVMLLGGAAEIVVWASGVPVPGYGAGISRATAVLGFFVLTRALPGISPRPCELCGLSRGRN